MNTMLENLKALSPSLIRLRKDRPEMYDAFQSVGKAVYRDGELSHQTKELLATAIALSQKCDPCIAHHVKALVRMGVTRGAFEEMLEVVVQMGGGPGLMKAGEALAVFDELTDQA